MTIRANLAQRREEFSVWWGHGKEAQAYGHLDLLRQFARVGQRAPLIGVLQHGWSLDDEPLYLSVDWPFPVFVWSSTDEAFVRRMGVTNVYAIGSPWLYLLQMAESFGMPTQIPDRGERTLVVPQHLGGRVEPREVRAGMERLLDLAMFEPVVLLHWNQYSDPIWHDELRGLGLQPRTLGPPLWPGAPGGTGSSFLWRLYAILAVSDQLVTDVPGSIVAYGASMGLRIEFSRYRFIGDNPRDETDYQRVWHAIEKIMEDWSLLAPGDLLLEARKSLGQSSLRSSSEMVDLMGWSSWSERVHTRLDVGRMWFSNLVKRSFR